jgi:asparagine synthase (glutamine-hydrolysing)
VSALAGCLWFDGRVARPADLAASTASAAHRSRRPFFLQVIGPVAIASSDHDGIYRTADTDLAVALDGRVDAYLRGECHTTHVATILDSYKRHGEDAAQHLIGDFAFAVWDNRASRLTCFRDAMGQRPLFYAVTDHCLIFGSEPQQVRLHPAVSTRVNEAMIAEYLSGQPATVGETLWQGVRRLPPAHALIADAHGVRLHRYWDLSAFVDASTSAHRHDPERLRELFEDAVTCRVAGARKVGVFLSGGIDSSCVAGMAQRLARKGHSARVFALSVKFPHQRCDETTYINEVLSVTGIDAVAMNAVPVSGSEVRKEVERYLDAPPYPNGLVLDPLRRRAASLGFDVVLTGYGGDEWFGGRVATSTELISSRRYFAGLTALLNERRAGNAASSVRLARALAGSILPSPVIRRIRRRRGTPPAWIRPDFASRVNFTERLRCASVPAFERPDQRRIYEVTQSAGQVIADEAEDRAAHAAGIDQRHPFCDRRIAEYGFLLPVDQRTSGRESKIALRQTFSDLLPQGVLERTDKAEFSSTFVEAFEYLGGIRLFENLASEEAGWVDGRVLRERYARMIGLYRAGDDAYIPWTEGLWDVIGLEVWLDRAVLNRGGGA